MRQANSILICYFSIRGATLLRGARFPTAFCAAATFARICRASHGERGSDEERRRFDHATLHACRFTANMTTPALNAHRRGAYAALPSLYCLTRAYARALTTRDAPLFYTHTRTLSAARALHCLHPTLHYLPLPSPPHRFCHLHSLDLRHSAASHSPPASCSVPHALAPAFSAHTASARYIIRRPIT